MDDYYKPRSGYLTNPFIPLYQEQIETDDTVCQSLWNFASDLEQKIWGDFDLDEMVCQIKSKLMGYVELGLLAYKIKSTCLWKKNKFVKSFQDFCLKIFNKSSWQINSYIEASRVVLELISMGFERLPDSLSQAVALAKFTGEELYHNWGECLRSIPPHRMSKRAIEELFDMTPPEEQKKQIKLPYPLWERLKKKALEEGKNIEELLEDFLGEGNAEPPNEPNNKTKTKKEKAWKKDLNKLCEENLIGEELKNINDNINTHYFDIIDSG